jgi:hypothetical protein
VIGCMDESHAKTALGGDSIEHILHEVTAN